MQPHRENEDVLQQQNSRAPGENPPRDPAFDDADEIDDIGA